MKTQITSNSQNVKPGDTFVAISGNKVDGKEFIPQAISNGATKIVLQSDTKTKPSQHSTSVEYMYTANVRKWLAQNIAASVGALPNNIVAVTGTNGKTSTAYYYAEILNIMGIKNTASIGTIGCRHNSMWLSKASLTTASPEELYPMLANLKQKHNIDYIALEASSHGLCQHRLDGLQGKVEAAAFTSLSPDHLDYHKNMDEYFSAKKTLFTSLLKHNGNAVINIDDDYGRRLKYELEKLQNHKITSYSKNQKADVYSDALHIYIADYKIEIPKCITADFMLSNLLAALALAHASTNSLPENLDNLKNPPGRMECYTNTQGNKILIDYAHTADALEKALKAALQYSSEIVVVFGCGGNRDKSKRATMGAIAAQYASYAIITDDNPRHEDAALIRNEIVAGINSFCASDNISALQHFNIVPNRIDAIQQALKLATKPGITLLIAGKGHEDYQIIGNEKLYHSDIQVVKNYLKEH